MKLLDAGRDLSEVVDVQESLAGPARRTHLPAQVAVNALQVAGEADQVRPEPLEGDQPIPHASAGQLLSAIMAPVAPRGEQRALVIDSLLRGETKQVFQ